MLKYQFHPYYLKTHSMTYMPVSSNKIQLLEHQLWHLVQAEKILKKTEGNLAMAVVRVNTCHF